jgi:uroporphyrinogen decarboxylase
METDNSLNEEDKTMNKREAVLSLLDDTQPQSYIPAAFFLHFPSEFHAGQAAVDKHTEFFRHTNMDIVKIQYERRFPVIPDIQKPEDWVKLPRYGKDFFEGQLEAVKGLVQNLKEEAVIIVTLYSPFMCIGHTVGKELRDQHLQQDPEAVKKGMETMTDSLLTFVRECVKLGVDGFYTSTQGGEATRFDDPSIFDIAIKPYDLTLMNEVDETCEFTILHVCDYALPYDDFGRFVAYPGNVVNTPLHVGDQEITMEAVARKFNRPFMGGMERLGILATGTPEQVKQATEAVLKEAPERFMLGADCTVPAETPWDNLKTAIETAHAWKQ